MLTSLSRIVFWLGLLILPFVFTTQPIVSFEGAKVFFFQRFVEILVVLYILQIFKNSQKIIQPQFIWLLVAYFFWNLVVSLTGLQSQTSIYGLFWRGQGLITLAHYLALVMILPNLIVGNVKNTGKILALAAFLVTSGLLINLVGHYFLNWLTFFYLDRPVGTFGNPNFLAGFIAVCSPLSFYFKKWLRWLLLGLFVLVIYLTGSRGALLAILLAPVIIGVMVSRFRKPALIFSLISLIGISLFFTTKFLWTRQGEYKCPFDSGCTNIAASRERIYARGFLAFLKNPIPGYGLENYELAVAKIDYPFQISPEYEVRVDKAHNEILEILLASGIVGFGLWALIVFLAIKNLLKAKEYLWLGSLVIFLIKSQTNVVSVTEYVLFWLIIGVAFTIGNQHRSLSVEDQK